jgi:hypothetical protein
MRECPSRQKERNANRDSLTCASVPERRLRSTGHTQSMSAMHIVDAQTGKRAQDAIRDILYLYRDLVAYEGVVGDHDLGAFDPWEFLQATRYGSWVIDDDLKLLHQGSAVAIICDLVDEMEQRRGDIERVRQALESGLFDDLPTAKEALQVGLAGPRQMVDASAPVYREYVIGYLSSLTG